MLDARTEKYVSLKTFRKDGREVATPVWIAVEADRSFIYTNGTSGKVKRIRNNGEVKLAPCDIRGKVRGEWVDARARMVEDEKTKSAVVGAFKKKYGWQMGLALMMSRLSGSRKDLAIIEVDL